jgi:hypothetical protein
MTAAGTGDARTVTVRIQFKIRKRGGRKLVLTPDGSPSCLPQRARVDNTVVKALARAFRWRKQLESGVHATVEEIAAAEAINPSYVSRVLRLSLLAPSLVEQILNGAQCSSLSLPRLMGPFPVEWQEQREWLTGESNAEDDGGAGRR